jgi:hypothetical protein
MSLFDKYQKIIATMLQSFKLIKIKKQIKVRAAARAMPIYRHRC